MDLVEQAVLRWQRLNQPRRFRESLVAAGEQLVCALAPHERTRMTGEGRADIISEATGGVEAGRLARADE